MIFFNNQNQQGYFFQVLDYGTEIDYISKLNNKLEKLTIWQK